MTFVVKSLIRNLNSEIPISTLCPLCPLWLIFLIPFFVTFVVKILFFVLLVVKSLSSQQDLGIVADHQAVRLMGVYFLDHR